jgi:hypothetical protein
VAVLCQVTPFGWPPNRLIVLLAVAFCPVAQSLGSRCYCILFLQAATAACTSSSTWKRLQQGIFMQTRNFQTVQDPNSPLYCVLGALQAAGC